MLNYIKSEFYRIFHSKEVYLLTVIFTVLITAYNVILYLCRLLPDFQYNNTWHSYGMIDTSMGICIYLIIVICNLLDGSSIQNMKNTVLLGVNRSIVYFGRIIVNSCICLVLYLYLMGLHFFLGKLLLEDSGREAAQIFIRSTFACIPLFLGVVALYHCCIFMSKNNITAAVNIIVILVVVPMGMNVIGHRVAAVKRVSDMLLYNLMEVNFEETVGGYYNRCFTWDTGTGVVKCIIAGISAVVIFSIIGIKYFQKKEIR